MTLFKRTGTSTGAIFRMLGSKKDSENPTDIPESVLLTFYILSGAEKPSKSMLV